MIFKEAILGLKNLETVRVDTEEFFSGSVATDYHPGIGCGRAHMFKRSSSVCDYEKPLSDNGYSRVYRLVLDVLEDVFLCTRVDLEMSSWTVLGGDEHHVPEYFSLQCPVWKDQASKKIRYLQFLGDIDPDWISNLPLSVPDLHQLEIGLLNFRIDDGSFRMYHTFSKTSNWPNLARVFMEDFTTTHKTFVSFIIAHQASLEYMWLSRIGFSHGTGSEPFAAISTMPKLKFYSFRYCSSEKRTRNHLSQTISSTLVVAFSKVEGVYNVERTTKALCSDLATVTRRYRTVQGEEGEFYTYVVDLRRGIAALSEEV